MAVGTRKSFDEQLRDLDWELLAMTATAEFMLENSVRALEQRDPSLAQEVVATDDHVDRYNLEIERRAINLLALQQPMAVDLRRIAASLKIITDIERIGDYCVDIAKMALRLSSAETAIALGEIPDMAQAARKMLCETIQAFVNRNLELVGEMIRLDDLVDKGYHNLFDRLVAEVEKNPKRAREAMQLLLIGRYIERIADHITNIGERVYYVVTGEIRELHP